MGVSRCHDSRFGVHLGGGAMVNDTATHWILLPAEQLDDTATQLQSVLVGELDRHPQGVVYVPDEKCQEETV